MVSHAQLPAKLCAGKDYAANQNNITIPKDNKQKAIIEHIHKSHTNLADKHDLLDELVVNFHMKNEAAERLCIAQSHPKRIILKDVTSIVVKVIENLNSDTLVNVKATTIDDKTISKYLTEQIFDQSILRLALQCFHCA